MSSGIEGVAPPMSRTAYVAERIKDDVANGVIKPGELIKQTVIAKRYGVSATPVREALRLLESDGVITYSAHRGASVRELNPESAGDLYRLRAAAEAVAAQIAVERMTPAGLQKVRSKHERLESALGQGGATPAELSVLNREFHFAIYEMSSPIIVQHLEILWSRFTPGSTVWRDQEDAAELQKEHDQILAAVEARDAGAAAALTAAHIEHAAQIRERHPETRAAGTDDRQVFPPDPR
ncbi:DNA-binding GntR family transcriptional regulator [Sinomonas atrocyanea]|uniref:GntR family transcriptional regulator n=1 Tax=Sinomonas atrocyanea TaxID=37927 RepID=UPI002789A5E8|nr:GntR family transcriptional regulator [Sinomonas atrocyanea]MDP9882854.1 DNA-binding GntR family transcriptional regulator [Sinomonas atrocyanea]